MSVLFARYLSALLVSHPVSIGEDLIRISNNKLSFSRSHIKDTIQLVTLILIIRNLDVKPLFI